MGLTKTEHFTEHQNRLAAYFKALAHPARIAILQVLIEKNACICGDIVEELPLAQPTVSQHLKELKQAGIIKGTIEGTSICYCVDETAWRDIQEAFGDFFKSYQRSSGCC
jgi:DNA-binding transcriptional ArsR family regulator